MRQVDAYYPYHICVFHNLALQVYNPAQLDTNVTISMPANDP
jgi:hypothetical protein